jgi:hypothetical protein
MVSEFPTIADFGGEVKFIRRYLNDKEQEWSVFNPSVMLSNEGEYWLAFRSSNYVIMSNGQPIATVEAKIRNRLFLCRLKEDWDLEESTLTEIDIRKVRSTARRGLEDPRLFWDGSNYCISTTYLEIDYQVARISKMALKSLEDPESVNFEILPSPRGQIEKNWMPIHKINEASDSDTDFIYNGYSVIKDKEWVLVDEPRSKTIKFRGGTQLLPLGDGTSICLIHQTYFRISPNSMNSVTFAPIQSMRQYTHRFVRYDSNYKIISYSDQFLFVKEGIEFASGIAPTDNGYVISFGRSDVAYYIATISREDALKTLRNTVV